MKINENEKPCVTRKFESVNFTGNVSESAALISYNLTKFHYIVSLLSEWPSYFKDSGIEFLIKTANIKS